VARTHLLIDGLSDQTILRVAEGLDDCSHAGDRHALDAVLGG
jgi:hypothetical protein